MPTLKLTKVKVEELPFTETGQVLYHDTEMKGFGLVVGAKTKTYFAQRAVNHRTIRYTIGRHGIFTTEQARREAQSILADMSRGNNPNQNKKEKRIKSITLNEALRNYIAIKQNLKIRTKTYYQITTDRYLSDWKNKPLEQITKEMVTNRNAYIRENHGGAVATNTMRALSAVWNNAKLMNSNLPENPVVILSLAKLWYKPKRRQSYIQPHQLKTWYEAVIAQPNKTVRDYLLLLLFTGMRKTEGLRLTWDCVDFEDSSFVIKETKNGDPLKLPMSNFVKQLLQERYDHRTSDNFVFPSHSYSGHVEEPKKVIAKIIESTGIKFMLHDLRRTFATTAESLDISHYSVKYMLNHKTGNDLTGGYIVMSIDRIREPMNKVADKLQSLIFNEPETVLNSNAR